MAIECPDVPATIPKLTLETLPEKTRLFRVGVTSFATNAWDTRPNADYRFSPLKHANGGILPVTYCGYSPEVALYETVLRFGQRRIEMRDLTERYLAEVVTSRPLSLIPLAGPASRILGESVAVAISHCPSLWYERTRAWATSLRDGHPDADGITWISRQHGAHRAIVIWQQHAAMTAPFLEVDRAALTSIGVLARLTELAQAEGVQVLP